MMADVVAVVGVACRGLEVALSPCWDGELLLSRSGVGRKLLSPGLERPSKEIG